ncbi:hypothetical protein BST81_08345 [Leptolyngbya sp. 'hensonii']|uniref:hypothetical protein n=1 Tax=Leptolyngbya sp. 'hensonii' TaxID=1922337 RepID=UPI000950181A|nr:hypothetical protein [Leptolyngbya sp. 'hensonii']OLP18914.1 hypothetical protein BST81_08345 [Leptolyngbya sp. 'hensonii']
MQHRMLLRRFILILLLGLLAWTGAVCAEILSPFHSPVQARSIPRPEAEELALQQRGLALRQHLAATDLNGLNTWWRQRHIPDPHKYLLPVILARLSLPGQYDPQPSWAILAQLDREIRSLYHFRSVFDVRLFFQFRSQMPASVVASYRSMVAPDRIQAWSDQGTENHMFMQRVSGLALMDGSGWPIPLPAIPATQEAWLRSEINKFLTIGQGEFHSSTYYGYSISSLLNLYDFARTPELKQLAQAGLDWFATNMALRLSWGTAGGAESRGFDQGTWDGSGLAAVAWVWWGDDPTTARRMPANIARVALNATLSQYRPPRQLAAIARKQIPLPFQLRASHPAYYSYHADNQFWETFYITPDYSLGTLLIPHRSYQTSGTINAQYTPYKLVIRDPAGAKNAVIRLGGTFHSPLVQGASPGDQVVQERGAVLYQLQLTTQDKAAGVPSRTHLVLPVRYGPPQRYRDWYLWRIERTWFCARPWGETLTHLSPLTEKNPAVQALVATGDQIAWVTDVASVEDYPTFAHLTRALDRSRIDDRHWSDRGQLSYISLAGDRLEMTYNPTGGIAQARINGKFRQLQNWDLLASPYVTAPLKQGILSIRLPQQSPWCWTVTPTGPKTRC